MSLNLFPARAYIGTFKDASGRQIGVHASPEFQRALNALKIRVGGDEALSVSDIETLLSFAAPPDIETSKAIHDLQVDVVRDHTAEIAELRKTVEELKVQLACLTDQTAAVAEVKKYTQDLEISYSFAPPLTDWEHPGKIGAKTTNTGAFTTISASGQITSTVSTGTAPLVIASTTEVANLRSATATALANARTIGGVSFNGTANITVETATSAAGFTVTNGFGCNGATAQTAYAVGAAATDAATTQTLANNIRLALIANGIATA